MTCDKSRARAHGVVLQQAVSTASSSAAGSQFKLVETSPATSFTILRKREEKHIENEYSIHEL